jgi:hypothetical protein
MGLFRTYPGIPQYGANRCGRPGQEQDLPLLVGLFLSSLSSPLSVDEFDEFIVEIAPALAVAFT